LLTEDNRLGSGDPYGANQIVGVAVDRTQNTAWFTLDGKKVGECIHPTVKPVALIADAIRDCSNQNDIILDPFGGAGTTLIAAERTGRYARLIEIDPLYVDATVRRWQHLTGKIAIHAQTAQPFGLTADAVAPTDVGLAEVGGRP
jgi:DNA modification methylase